MWSGKARPTGGGAAEGTRMKRRARWSAVAAIALVAVVVPAAFGPSAASASPEPPGPDTLLVGAASRSVLPLVDGNLDYLAAGFPARSDPYDPGIVVPAWDDGRIAVGNGDSFSAWVHDDLRVTALAVEDPRSPELV